jgi:hypothetical protein
MGKYKSPDSDQILAQLIQAGSQILVSVIHKLTNSVWNWEELADQWKESIIVPIRKKCDSKAGCNIYRRIPLLSTSYNMKNGVFWDVMLCGSCKNRRFEGT